MLSLDPVFIAAVERAQGMNVIAGVLGHGGIHDQVHDLAEGAEGIGECLHPLPLACRTGDRRHQGGVIAIPRVLPRPGLIGSLHPVDGGVEPQERGQTRGLPRVGADRGNGERSGH